MATCRYFVAAVRRLGSRIRADVRRYAAIWELQRRSARNHRGRFDFLRCGYSSARKRRGCVAHGLLQFHAKRVGNLLKALHSYAGVEVRLPALNLLFFDFEPLS